MKASRRLAATILLVLVQPAWAVQCSVGATGLSFGTYDPFSSQGLDTTGSISVTCDAAVSYSVSLSPGSGSYISRVMASGPHTLNYNLFTNAARTVVWGDGSGGTAVVDGSIAGPTVNHTVYGRIPARQNAHIGSYGDIITVTVTF